MTSIHKMYRGVIMGMYKEKFNNLTYHISPEEKLRREAQSGKTITSSRLESAKRGVSADAVTFGYIIGSLKNVRFRPYKEISEVLGAGESHEKADYFFPVFTENGVKTTLKGRNLETEFQLISREEAEALREILYRYDEQIATGYNALNSGVEDERVVMYSPYRELVDRLFVSAESAGRLIQMGAGQDQIMQLSREMRNMEVLGQAMFSPDFSNMIETPEQKLKRKVKENQTAPKNEPEYADKILMDGTYASSPIISDGKVVVVLSPTEAPHFKLVHEGKNLMVTQEEQPSQPEE